MPNELAEQAVQVMAGQPAQTVEAGLGYPSPDGGTVVIPYGNETSDIRIRVVRYCQGLGLDLGCGGEKIIPQAIGIDQQPGAANLLMDMGKLNIFQSGVFDFVYSSHAIEDVFYKEPVLVEWWRVLRPNGYLILAWPNWTVYKDNPEVESNQDHKEKVSFEDFHGIFKEARFDAEIVLEESAGRSNLIVLRKLKSGLGTLKKKEPLKAEKTALVVRYGAFGDAIIVTPLFRALKEQGYHITVNCSDYCRPVLENNPHIDELIVHLKDSVKNDGKELHAYWKHLEKSCDRFINLSGSIEGDMLKLEGIEPLGCDTHIRAYQVGCEACEQLRAIRDKNLGDVNYYDRTMKLGGFPELTGQKGELFFTHGEVYRGESLVRKWRNQNRFVVIWSMSGSSFHKAYPYWATCAVEFCRKHKDAMIYTVGDHMSSLMEVIDHPQIHPRCNKWRIRESMLMTKYADLVIGGETGILHAAGCYDTPKIVILSHSTPKNLCATWDNWIALEPDRAQAPCHPCHQMHYTKESCPLKPFPSIIHLNYDEPPVIQPPPPDQSQLWPVCMTHGISLDKVMSAMEYFYDRKVRPEVMETKWKEYPCTKSVS